MMAFCQVVSKSGMTFEYYIFKMIGSYRFDVLAAEKVTSRQNVIADRRKSSLEEICGGTQWKQEETCV
jgi:hypothetical protein